MGAGSAGAGGGGAAGVETREALVQLAREVIAYDRDTCIEGVLPMLAMLYRNASVHFWWD